MGKNGKAPTNTVKASAGAKNGIAPIISELPQLQQRRRRSHRPWGCCPCRSGPSSLRERGRRKNQRTVRHHGHGRGYRSGHRKRDLQRRCRDAGYGRYRRRKQRRSFNLAWNFARVVRPFPLALLIGKLGKTARQVDDTFRRTGNNLMNTLRIKFYSQNFQR